MVKKIFAGLAALLCAALAVSTAGCRGGSSNGTAGPGQVVEDFWAAVSRGDARAAYDLFSRDDQAEMTYECLSTLFDEPSEKPLEVEIVSEKIDGDSARVGASYEGVTLDFDLVREDGAWKLDGIASFITRAEKQARKGECFDNLRTIDSAVMQFSAANNGSYPQTIEQLIPNYIRKMPVCPEGGSYVFDASGRIPDVSCSVHGDY